MATTATVTGIGTQKNPYQTFLAHRCTQPAGSGSNTPCPAGSWWFGMDSCGAYADQRLCSNLQPGICSDPVNYGMPAVEEEFPNDSTALKRPFPATVNCTFNANQFDTLAKIQNWIKLNGTDEQLNSLILPSFCAGTSTNCPFSSDGTQMKTCSRLLATDQEGNLCRQFAATDLVGGDTSIGEYCNTAANSKSPECACVLRTADPLYKALKAGNPICDSCWYIPCLDSNSKLIPSDVRNNCSAVTMQVACPTQFCTTVIQAIDNNQSNININAASQVVTCDLKSIDPNAPNPPTPDSTNPQSTDNRPPKIQVNALTGVGSFFTKYGWWVLGIAALVLILIIAAFLVEKHTSVNPTKTFVVHHNMGEHAPNAYARPSAASYHKQTGTLPGSTTGYHHPTTPIQYRSSGGLPVPSQ
jgi:Pox virus entry-fusion-complex G9/A16